MFVQEMEETASGASGWSVSWSLCWRVCWSSFLRRIRGTLRARLGGMVPGSAGGVPSSTPCRSRHSRILKRGKERTVKAISLKGG